ncbi:Nitrate regulatory gene2 protein [Senna tora]|uniref:Nitrate regulatory gene2 protein n=1 Tax=Senna tora TaxID=362788 RepID=A0A834U0P3_9FABA|nr:Nitrate regulatory gene2 protein [Senna tora]
MGCNTSRLDGLPAVALCRDRCKFLDEALRQSYALADAHVAHMHSLKTLAPALYTFFHHTEDPGVTNSQDAVDNTKSHPQLTKSPPRAASDSHIQLHSETETETEINRDKDFQFFNPTSRYDYLNHDTVSDDVVFMNYVQPPSPPPPTSSAWDFFNFFETFDKYDARFSPSPDVHKEHQRSSHHSFNNKATQVVDGGATKAENGDPEEVKTDSTANVKSPKAVMKEIQILLERASDSGNPILEMLDVGKLRYHKKIAVNPVSCKMMHVFTPSVSSKPPLGQRRESGCQGIDKDKGFCYGNLSSTLNKLSMWENKLYHEVKAEEKLHILHEKKCRQLIRMNKKGADAQKVDSIETLIRILSTKMRISIQVVDNISTTICKLREEELWPQINQFILRFLGMWKDMVECYRRQNEKIEEAKSIAFNRKLISKAQVDAAIRLKSELQNWNLSFSDWIYAQKCYVKALNGWLLRFLQYDPEEIADSTAPMSPGAPSVIVICNKWSQAVDKLWEKDVIEAVNELISCINELLEKYVSELEQKLTVDKELEKKMKMLEREEHKMHKVVQARERKMVSIGREESDALLAEEAVRHAQLFDTVNLESGLKHIFAAMHSFTAISASVYEQLCQHIQQHNQHVLGESDRVH